MRHLAQRNEYDRGTSRSRCDRATDRRDGTRCASFFGVRRGPLQRAAMRDASFARKPMAEGARVGPASRGQRRKRPPRATTSVVLLVSGRWERADAGSWPEIARGDLSRRVLPIVIRGVRRTPGPITLVIDLGYRCYAPRRRQGRSHARFPGARARTQASSTTDAKRSAPPVELEGLIDVDTLAPNSRSMPPQILRALCWSVPRPRFLRPTRK